MTEEAPARGKGAMVEPADVAAVRTAGDCFHASIVIVRLRGNH